MAPVAPASRPTGAGKGASESSNPHAASRGAPLALAAVSANKSNEGGHTSSFAPMETSRIDASSLSSDTTSHVNTRPDPGGATSRFKKVDLASTFLRTAGPTGLAATARVTDAQATTRAQSDKRGTGRGGDADSKLSASGLTMKRTGGGHEDGAHNAAQRRTTASADVQAASAAAEKARKDEDKARTMAQIAAVTGPLIRPSDVVAKAGDKAKWEAQSKHAHGAKKGKKQAKEKAGWLSRLGRWSRRYMWCMNVIMELPCCGGLAVYSFSSDVAALKPFFDAIAMTEKEVGVCYMFFNRIDVDRSGSITVSELLDFIGLEKSDFNKRVFSVFDEDNSGSVDFREFVISMWNYLTQTKASLTLFAFDLYDRDFSGQLEVAEIKKMLGEVYGDGVGDNPHARQVIIDLHERAGVTPGVPVYMGVADFGDFCRQHPALLMPVFLVQDTLQRCICGQRFWRNATDKRLRLSNGKYVPISVLIESALSENAAERVESIDHEGTKSKVTRDSQAMRYVHNIGGIVAARRGSLNQTKLQQTFLEAEANHHEEDRPRRRSKDMGTAALMASGASHEAPRQPGSGPSKETPTQQHKQQQHKQDQGQQQHKQQPGKPPTKQTVSGAKPAKR